MTDTAPAAAAMPPAASGPIAPKTSDEAASTSAIESIDDYITTAAQNYISRHATLHGAQRVEIRGKTIIERGVNIYGENCKVRIGRYCRIGKDVSLKPATIEKEGGGDVKYLPLSIGANTVIGSTTISEAYRIGSSVIVGSDCTLGNRCVIKDCVYIENGTVVPSDMVIPPFSIVRGSPAQILSDEMLPESSVAVIPEMRVEEYIDFVEHLKK